MEVEVGEILKQFIQKSPGDLHPYFSKFEELYEKKLWHQLTQTYFEFMKLPAAKPLLIPVYEKFVCLWEKKLKPTSLVQICLETAHQYPDPTNSIAILQKVVEKVKQDNGAYVLARMEVANFKIGLNDINAASEIIQESQVILDSLSSVDPLIHGSFYRVCSVYHKVRAEYAPYYKNSLLYLACINEAQDLSVEDRVERAHDLCLAALLSDKIYNFGELLMHPILDSLSSTAHSWLSDLIFAFNAGDIGKYDSLSSQFHKQPLLTRNSVFLRQKLCLMALIELTFKSLGSGRCLGFETISQETRIPITEVEHLLMKALSLNLIKGKIDQVNQSIKVDWVQPRVLDRNQIKNLSVQLEGWHEKVGNIAKSVQQQVEE